MDGIDSAIAAADRAWRRYGVGPADRATLDEDLRLDCRLPHRTASTPASCSARTSRSSPAGSPTRPM